MPYKFLNTSISRILFISASCTAFVLLLWLHPLCHPFPCVPFTGQHQIFIASLFFNRLRTPVSQPFSPHSSIQVISLTSEKGLFNFSDGFSSSFQPCGCLSLHSNSDLFLTLYHLTPSPSVLSVSSHALVPYPPPPPPCMLKYSVKEGSRGGGGGERAAGRGGIGGGGSIDVKSAAVVMIFCSLFLGTSGHLRATVSSTVFTGSWKEIGC